ncbi:hypothetical protein ABBQ38_005694 [Trebouxia sp. C0009 RCD-2024]
MLKQHPSFSALTSPSLTEREPEQQALEMPIMLEARRRTPSLFSEDDLPSPGSLSARHKDPPEDNRRFFTKLLHFCISNWEKALVLGILITLIVLVSVKGFSIFGTMLAWFEKQNNWKGWALFLPVYTVNVAVFLPGVIFILGAGFVFGFWKGLLAVWIGGSLGQPLAFLLARYLLRDAMASMLRAKWKKWDILDTAIEREGWKLLLLLRLSPMVPYNLLNIAMATTKMHFVTFSVVSAFGIIPECSIICYFGSLSEGITQIASGKAGPSGVVTYVLVGVTAVFMLAAVTWSTFVVRRAMARAEADMGVTPAGSPTTDPPHAVAPMGSAAAGGDDNDEEAQMLHARASLQPSEPLKHRVRSAGAFLDSPRSEESPWSPHDHDSPRQPLRDKASSLSYG